MKRAKQLHIHICVEVRNTTHYTRSTHAYFFEFFKKPQVPTFNEPRVKQPSNKQLNISIIGIFRAATLGTVMARTFALADADRTTAFQL